MAVTSSIRGKNAITNYEVIAEGKEASLLKITIETGRTHQIRVHMKHINHPILGDKVYGIKDDKSGAERQMLHAGILEFTHPISLKNINLTAPLPDDFIEICRKYKLEYEAVEL
jgi:23S rRNA pseudouridine1911/1915/1917 synthase